MTYTVITPVPLILKALDDEIKARYPNITTQYDPTMSYEETVKGVRYTRSSMKLEDSQTFPLLAFSRSSVIGQEDIPRRQRPMRTRPEDHVADQYRSRLCQFDYLFKFYERDVIMSDTFEVMFGTHTSINDIKTITVSLPSIGDFEYQCIWKELDEIEFNKDDSFYISSSGSCTIQGQFIVMKDTSYPLIEIINANIQNYTGAVNYHTLQLGQISAPNIQPFSGAYPTTEIISMSCSIDNVDIHYTLNGDDPTITDPVYSEPFLLEVSRTIKAKAFHSIYPESVITTRIYATL